MTKHLEDKHVFRALWSLRDPVFLLGMFTLLVDKCSTSQTGDVITAARCRVRCLIQLKNTTDMPHLAGAGKESMALINCLKLADCTACLKPCNHPILSADACLDICSLPKEDDVCLESCQFLQQIKFAHSGSCPSYSSSLLSRHDGMAAHGACGRACAVDADCDANLKCCTQKCGRTCTGPHFVPIDFPPIPETPSLKEKPKSGAIELKWNSVSNSSSGPLLYIVDSRWSIGRNHVSKDMTQWQQVAQTSSTSAMINDITPGHWYQFRVSSVNVHGTRGGSVPTQAFTLSKDPRKPGRPTNLTEGDTLIMGSRMAVTLHWFPPDKSDLPITRYKLFWNKRSRSSVLPVTSPRESRHVLPGHKLVFQIPNLESATTYFVQVQAICQYGDIRLKSEKSGIYITTYPVPQASDMFPSVVDSGAGGNSKFQAVPAPLNLTAQHPFYLNGVLSVNVSWVLSEDPDDTSIDKVLVHWSPEACIADSTLNDDLSKIMSSSTQDSFFVIHDLRPDCRYVVKVETVSSRGVTGSSTQISLSTPSCGNAPVLGKNKPDCLNNVPRVPEEPPNLVHSFVIRSSNLTSRLNWGIPESVSPITGYRIEWGQLLHIHTANPTMDKSTAVTKVLPKNVQTFSIGSMNEGTTYLVRVQALSRTGAGRIASVQFTTPLLQVKSVDQPYREFGQSGDGRKSDPSKRKNLTVVTTVPHLYIFGDKTTVVHQIRQTVTLASLRLTYSLTTIASHLVLLVILNLFKKC